MDNEIPTTPPLPPAPTVAPEPIAPSDEDMRHHKLQKKHATIGSVILVVILIIAAVVLYPNYAQYVKNIPGIKTLLKTPQERVAEKKNGDSPILKVGDEIIYQKDFDFEKSGYPPVKNFDIDKILMDKLTADSVILQGAKVEGLISVDTSVFNSNTKSYQNRIKLIEKAKQAIEDHADSIIGEFVVMWFYNDTPPKMDVEKGKEIVLGKITKLHDDIKSGKITMKQAADAIRNDTSLIDIDRSYKSNAYKEFAANPNKPITIDKNFDALLWKLNVGEVSDVFLGKATPLSLGKKVDAWYGFGTVMKKTTTGKIANFDGWLAAQEKIYAVTYY